MKKKKAHVSIVKDTCTTIGEKDKRIKINKKEANTS